MPSSKTLLRLAEQADREAENLEAELALAVGQEASIANDLEVIREDIEAIKTAIAAHKAAGREYRNDAAASPLPSIADQRSMLSSKMEIQIDSKRVKIARTMTGKSAAKSAMLDAGVTPMDVAKLLHTGRSTVNAWCTGARSIPKAYAERLRAKYGIPVKVWEKLGA